MTMYPVIHSGLKQLESYWEAIVAVEATSFRRRPRLYAECADLLRSIRRGRREVEGKLIPKARPPRRSMRGVITAMPTTSEIMSRMSKEVCISPTLLFEPCKEPFFRGHLVFGTLTVCRRRARFLGRLGG